MPDVLVPGVAAVLRFPLNVDDLLDRGDYDDLDFEEANRYARELARPRDADDMGDGPMGKGL